MHMQLTPPNWILSIHAICMISISTHHQFAVMAASWYSQKTHLLTSFRVTLSLLLVATSGAAPLAFNYKQLSSSTSNTANAFIISGDAYQDKQNLQLTKSKKDSLGRVIYSKRFHLWDLNSGKVTDFTTSFSFTINTPNKTYYGDGITFFLAHPNFPPPDPRDGAGIGLLSRVQLDIPNYTEEHPFVAVEFDTVYNKELGDPEYQHVGIDVHSMKSACTTKWFSSMDERGYDADVSYNSGSNNLSVTFTGYKDNIRIKQHLSCLVNLRDVLPDWVEFGFTSATGLYFEEHTLSSWSFNSSLDFEAHKDEGKTGMVIGLSVGDAGVLICVLGLACFVARKLRRNKGMKDGLHYDFAMDSDFERSSLPRKSKTPAFENSQTGTSTSSNSTFTGSSAAWTYDVFLNFRGEDTRSRFTSTLYNSLKREGIRTFFDDVGIEKGEEITPALRKAITESRIFIAVFSKSYASSTFCLDELVMILEYKAQGRLFLPVFYDVDPSQVRHQNGAYAKALTKHEERFRDDKGKVQKWRDALHEAANVAGFNFQHGIEFNFITEIVQKVSVSISPWGTR